MKLFCELCADYRHADDFSAGQRRNPPEWTVGGQGRRFCLRHKLREQNTYIERLRRHARAAIRGGGSEAGLKTLTETARPLVTTTRALSKHGCPLLSLLFSPTFRTTPMRAIRVCAGSLIILEKSDSDSANSHSQDEGEVGRKRSMWFKTRRNHATTATRSRQAMGKRPRTMT